MKLSIITINYNNKTGLEKTMQSVLQQTTSDFEYILIDGASTDGSREVIEQYVANPEHSKKITYWVSEKDTGIYNAMNKGIRQAKGEFCLFLNSGDWLVENATLENVLPQIDGTVDVYYSDCFYPENNCQKIREYPKKIDVNFFITGTINHQNSIISKKRLLETDSYNEDFRICADWLFFLHIAWKKKGIFKYIQTPISIYTLDGISNSSKTIFEREQEHEKGIVLVFQELSPTIIELVHYRESVYGKTIELLGQTAFYVFYLKVYRFFARRMYKILRKIKK